MPAEPCRSWSHDDVHVSHTRWQPCDMAVVAVRHFPSGGRPAGTEPHFLGAAGNS